MEGNGKCRYECKKRHVYEKYLASIVHNQIIKCDRNKESYDEEDAVAKAKSNNEAQLYVEKKTIPTNFNERKAAC